MMDVVEFRYRQLVSTGAGRNRNDKNGVADVTDIDGTWGLILEGEETGGGGY